MEYRRMGRTGLKASEICLGTMSLGHGTDQAEARRIVDFSFDAGVNFFDTANSYMEKNWHERRDGALDMPSLEG